MDGGWWIQDDPNTQYHSEDTSGTNIICINLLTLHSGIDSYLVLSNLNCVKSHILSSEQNAAQQHFNTSSQQYGF